MQFKQHDVQCVSPSGLHRMAYTEWGVRDNPRVLICVHGLTRNGRDFDALAQALAADYRVICPDVVGRGQSSRLRDPSAYGIAQYVVDMVTLIARLDVDSVHWLGTSMGGMIGMAGVLVFGLMSARPAASSNAAVRVALRAEAAKVAVMVLLLWLVFAAYQSMVVLVFLGAFVVSVLLSGLAFAVSGD